MKDQLQTIRAALTKRGWATEKEAAEALTALAQLEAMVGEQEPVAWQHKVHEGGKWLTTDLDPDAAAEWNFLHESRPLYAAPVAQQPQAEAVPSDVVLDAERYRWLRDPLNDVALVLDERTEWVPPDESIAGIGGYWMYEYRSGEKLDLAIDAAIAAAKKEAGHE